MAILREERRSCNLTLLNLATDNVDGILRKNKIVLRNLLNLLNKARIRLIILNQNLITGVLVLTNDRLLDTRVSLVVKLDGTLKLLSELCSLKKRGGRREGCLKTCRGNSGSRVRRCSH